MKKWSINYILFIFLVISGLIQAVSGFLLWLVIPGGHRGFGIGGGLARTGNFIWSRYTWIEIHDWSAVALVIIVIIHIILHWNWIIYTTKKILGIRKRTEETNGK
jgi:predicted permease